MPDDRDGTIVRTSLTAARLLAGGAMAVALLVSLGGLLGRDRSGVAWPGGAPVTALGPVLVAVLAGGVLLQTFAPRLTRRAGRTLSAAAAGIAVVLIVTWMTALLHYRGTLSYADALRQVVEDTPGRPSAQTAAAVLSLALGGVLLTLGGRRTGIAFPLVQVPAWFLIVGVLLAPLYGATHAFVLEEGTGMSYPAALGLALVAGATAAARPDRAPMTLLTDPIGRRILVRLAPLILVLPLVQVTIEKFTEARGATHEQAMTDSKLAVVLVVAAYAAVLSLLEARAERRLARERALVAASFLHAPSAMALVTPDGRVRQANPTLAALVGRQPDLLVGLELTTLVGEPDRPGLLQRLEAVASGQTAYERFDVGLLLPSGSTLWVDVGVTPAATEDVDPVVVVQLVDVTDRRAREASLEQRATHDPLTGLGNRDLLARVLDEQGARPREDRETVVVYVDLDGFKEVNDRYGHDVGDRVLQLAATRLTDAVRAEDLVARLGGDEFVVVAEVSDGGEVHGLVERLRAVLSGDLEVPRREGEPVRIPLGASIGATMDRGRDRETVLAEADRAMYEDKRRRALARPR
ncbi:MAG: GGDEF domain-containing protein [Candidatus Nanopelagicales bacterium]